MTLPRLAVTAAALTATLLVALRADARVGLFHGDTQSERPVVVASKQPPRQGETFVAIVIAPPENSGHADDPQLEAVRFSCSAFIQRGRGAANRVRARVVALPEDAAIPTAAVCVADVPPRTAGSRLAASMKFRATLKDGRDMSDTSLQARWTIRP